MKILIVTPSFPYPPDTGGTIRIYNLIKNLAKENEIQLISLAGGKINEDAVSELKKYCTNVHLAHMTGRMKLLQIPKVIGRFMKGQPFMLKYAESDELNGLLRNITNECNIDIIQFEHSFMANNVSQLCGNLKARKVLMFHNIACAQYYRVYKVEKSIFKKIRHLLEWVPMFNWEPKIAEYFDKSVVVSDIDKNLLQFLNPMLDISVIPNGVDAKSIIPFPLGGRGKSLLFVGSMDYEPNEDAVRYFCKDVFPLLKKDIPEIKLTVVGKNPPTDLQKLSENPDIIITGHVDDILPFYQKAVLSVVPLRSGGGTRLKILEAMATGTPIVSTAIGCEGLDVVDNKNIMIANTPEEFANKIIHLVSNEDAWNKVALEGRKLVEEMYDWELIACSLQDVYKRLVHS